MPVFFEEIIRDHCRVTVWHISESTEDLQKAYTPHRIDLPSHKNIERNKQSMAAVVCAKHTIEEAGLTFGGIMKAHRGKPSLKENIGYVSLAHTKSYAAASFCPYGATGIDLEQIHNIPKVLSVVSKFMNREEIEKFGMNAQDSLLCWSAKEALYKLSEKSLSLKNNIEVLDIEEGKSGTIRARIILGTDKADLFVNYRIFDKFVLTCAFKDE